MKKALIVLLAGGLVAGSIVAPAAAKKKKPKKPPAPVAVASELKYYLHWDDDGAGGCGPVYMSLEDKEDLGSGCESTALAAQEVLIAAGEGLSREWPAQDGLPFVLDTTRKITGEITMRGAAAAQSRVEVVVSGTVDGEVKEIAKGETQTVTFALSGQTGPQILKFELEADPALNGKNVESLVLTTTVRGVNGATYFDLENPPSFMVVPSLTFQ